jgi:hypothetical protein
MHNRLLYSLLAILVCTNLATISADDKSAVQKPNIIFILSDDVGLGKTYSTISHIMCQRANDIAHGATWDLNNCVIIPSRLLQQWKFEIEKYTQPKTISVVTLGSITDIKKLYKKAADGTLYMPVKYDVYIISVNLLNNKNYTAYIADNYEQTLETPVYNLNKYFDIFRIFSILVLLININSFLFLVEHVVFGITTEIITTPINSCINNSTITFLILITYIYLAYVQLY